MWVCLQAHPEVPLVERLEDLWLLHKLQAERKSKAKAETVAGGSATSQAKPVSGVANAKRRQQGIPPAAAVATGGTGTLAVATLHSSIRPTAQPEAAAACTHEGMKGSAEQQVASSQPKSPGSAAAGVENVAMSPLQSMQGASSGLLMVTSTTTASAATLLPLQGPNKAQVEHASSAKAASKHQGGTGDSEATEPTMSGSTPEPVLPVRDVMLMKACHSDETSNIYVGVEGGGQDNCCHVHQEIEKQSFWGMQPSSEGSLQEKRAALASIDFYALD